MVVKTFHLVLLTEHRGYFYMIQSQEFRKSLIVTEQMRGKLCTDMKSMCVPNEIFAIFPYFFYLNVQLFQTEIYR